jgi:zinc protease
MRLAKEQLEHSLAFEFQSAWDVARTQAIYEYYGLPADWTLKERHAILATPASSVLRAAQRHLHPDRLLIVAVGDEAKAATALATFGTVTPLPLPSA